MIAALLVLTISSNLDRAVFAVGCRSPPSPSGLLHFKNFRLEEKRTVYNNGRENRKWLIWKEAGEKILREHGVDENTTLQIRTDGRADFNSDRRFYHWTSDFGEYLEGMADKERDTEGKTVADMILSITFSSCSSTVILLANIPFFQFALGQIFCNASSALSTPALWE